MFGKNYDEQIKLLTELTGNLTKTQHEIIEHIGTLQEQMIQIAKVQVTHKEIVSFLLNHGTVDSETTQEDVGKMMQKIIELNRMVKDNKEKAKK